MAERLTFQQERERRSPGFKAVSNAYYESFQGGASRFQGRNTEQERARSQFVEQVLGNPAITLQDVVDFMADRAIYESIMSSYTIQAAPGD